MEKIKDFLYNKNDILVALLILAIAATVIVFRIDAIMEYPKTLVDQQQQTVEENTAELEKQAQEESNSANANDKNKTDEKKSTDDKKSADDKKTADDKKSVDNTKKAE